MRLSRILALPLAALLLSALPAPAAQINTAAIPADARWLIHIDLDQFRATRTYATLKDKFTGQRRTDFETRIQQLQRLTGINPATDLHDVTLYSSTLGENDTVLLLHASLNQNRILTFLRRNPDFKSTPHNSHEIICWRERLRDRIIYGSFATKDLAIVAPSESLVASALDALDAKAAAPSPLLADIKPNTIAYIAGRDLAELRKTKRAASPLIDQIDSASLALSESTGSLTADMTVNTKSPEIADRLSKFIDGLKASNALAITDPDPPPRVKILDAIFPSLDTNITGSTLTLHCTLPADQLEPTLRLLSRPAAATTQEN